MLDELHLNQSSSGTKEKGMIDMMLNNISYVHKLIRTACQMIEQKEDAKLVTDLSSEFSEVTFVGKNFYFVIDYKNKTWLYHGREIQQETESLVDDVILYLGWLEIGQFYNNLFKAQKK